MQKFYYSIQQRKFNIAIEKNSLDLIKDFGDCILKKNPHSNVLWSYQEKLSRKKGFFIYLDILFENITLEFSTQSAVLFYKNKDCYFGFFTNQKILSFSLEESKKIPITEKIFKLLPTNLLRGIFSGMYKNKKPILCLDIKKCFDAYKHLAQ